MKPHVARPLLLIGIALLLLLVGQAAMPGFLSGAQIGNQLKIAAFLGLFGLCQTIVIAAGAQGLDLSVGAAASLGGILGAAIMQGSNDMTALGLLAATAAGLLVGTANGIGIAIMRVPPLVATLAMASVVDGGVIAGVAMLQPSNAASPALVWLAGWSTAGLPHIVVLWAILAAIAIWLLSASAWGRRLAATGANQTAALLSGTDTRLVRVLAYAISGGLAAFAGFLLTGYVGQAFFGLGDPYILTSIVVATIGGATFAGGRAPYLGVACAAIMMTVLVSLLTALTIGEAGRQVIFGATLLAFLALDRVLRGRPGAARLRAPSRHRRTSDVTTAPSAPDPSSGG